MKNFILIFLFWIFSNVNCIGQVLPSPIFTSLPSIGQPGLNSTATTNAVPGATQYVWTSQTLNGLLFNGYPSPFITSVPTVQISFILPLCEYELCVTAQNACCSSLTSCAFIKGYAPITFASQNSPNAQPGISLPYNVTFSNQIQGVQVTWFTTGDITINGTGNNSVTTNTFSPSAIILNFGNSFSSGTLCAYSSTGVSGIICDTICITINNSLGIDEFFPNNVSVNYNNNDNLININFDQKINQNFSVDMFDLSGKKFISKRSNTENSIHISTKNLCNGIYYVKLTNGQIDILKKIAIVRN